MEVTMFKLSVSSILLIVISLYTDVSFASTFEAGLACSRAGRGVSCDPLVDGDDPPAGFQCFWKASNGGTLTSPPNGCNHQGATCHPGTYDGKITVTIVDPYDMNDAASVYFSCNFL